MLECGMIKMISLKKVSVDNPYSMHVRVYIDGEYQKYAQFVDSENGYVERVAMDSQGEIILNAIGVVFEKVHGEVEIFYSR
jgi:hypothetical protein